jgi:hypothetical protein
LSLDSVITAIASDVVPVVTTILTVAGSIIGIFFAHHLKVSREIAIRRKIELFDRKQKAYRNILKTLSKMQDHSYFIGTRINWKITRHMYDEIILVGSKEVVEKTNDLLLDNSPDSQETDKKMKNLWNAIRKDLYGEEIPFNQMHVIKPDDKTITALEVYHKYSAQLKILGIDTPEKASEMDIEKVNNETQIDKNNLNLIKKMTNKELEYEQELKRFLENA